MRFVKWGLAAAVLFVVSGAVAYGVVARSGTAEAQQPDKSAAVSRYEELLAQKLGISVTQLQTAQKGARDQMIDEAVASGKITADQAAKLKSLNPSGIRGHFLKRLHGGAIHVFKDVIAAAAGVIGISNNDVHQGLHQGQSLTQIASQHGVSRDQLKSGLVSKLQADIRQALANGQLTQAQVDRLITGLNERLDQIIDHAGFKGGPKGRGGLITP